MKDMILRFEEWSRHVVEGVDIKDLKKALREKGHLTDNDELTLVVDGEDYRKAFWQHFDVAFHEDILSK